jgi:uncharacterized protein YprB with RNaseH-like and TPR domain
LSSLADRIRGIVSPGTSGPKGPDLSALPGCFDLAVALGGSWRGGAFVVDRRWEPSALHGRERIGALAERLERSAGEAPLFTGGTPARPPFVFFDLETTGLSGGAGTLAFLVGCGWFEGDGSFVTRQFLLARHADERMLLEAVAAELARAGALVSFNGKSFDAPLLEGRYLFHRIAWRGREMPHVDVLHPARRFWKAPATGARAFSLYGARGSDEAGCSLQSLERQLVGLRRQGDVPGFEIPALYFQFVRSGDAGPLGAVLEHNRLDLLTLAALTARLMDLTRRGPDAAGDAREALALGHVYARAHRQAQGALNQSNGGALDERARTSFRRAIDRCRSPRGAYDPIRIEALRALALACRRAQMHDEAAASWHELVEMRGCPAPILRAAAEALAIHHEHRVRDLTEAKAFALRNLESGRDLGWADAALHRLARLERKLATESLKFEV